MNPEWLLPWLISNGLSLGLIMLALYRPRWVQGFYSLLFVAAAGFNAYTAVQQPQSYVTGFGPQAAWFYQPLIYGWFSRYTTVLVLLIALGQLIAGLLLLNQGSARLGRLGCGLFLLAITPLGIGSAFPAPLLMLASLYLLDRQLQPDQALSTGLIRSRV